MRFDCINSNNQIVKSIRPSRRLTLMPSAFARDINSLAPIAINRDCPNRVLSRSHQARFIAIRPIAIYRDHTNQSRFYRDKQDALAPEKRIVGKLSRLTKRDLPIAIRPLPFDRYCINSSSHQSPLYNSHLGPFACRSKFGPGPPSCTYQ